MNLKLDHKLALVSGSTAGIGYAIAEALAAEGARVIVNGRTQPAVDTAIASIRKNTGKEALGFAGDLSSGAVAEALVKAHPGIEILVNNLGIFEAMPFEQIPDDDWRRFFDVNVLSGARLARLVLPAMRRANWGRILFISSESAVQIPVEMIHYGVTKTAQLAVSRGLAELTKGTSVTVNSVLPGPTMSEGVETFVKDLAKQNGQSLDQAASQFVKQHRGSSLIQRFATVDEIANMVVYVSSREASVTNGAALRAEGGIIQTIA